MLGSFLLAAIAGFAVVHAEPFLETLLDKAMPDEDVRFDGLDFRVLTLCILLVLVGIVLVLIGADSALIPAALGAGLGYFGTRIYAILRDPDAALADPEIKDQTDQSVTPDQAKAPAPDRDPS